MRHCAMLSTGIAKNQHPFFALCLSLISVLANRSQAFLIRLEQTLVACFMLVDVCSRKLGESAPECIADSCNMLELTLLLRLLNQ